MKTVYKRNSRGKRIPQCNLRNIICKIDDYNEEIYDNFIEKEEDLFIIYDDEI